MPKNENEQPAADNSAERRDPNKNYASYASDKRKGGYLVRVSGPNCDKFVGREVPVSRMDGTSSMEKLTKVVWSGVDDQTGGRVTLYAFEARPRDEALQVEWTA